MDAGAQDNVCAELPPFFGLPVRRTGDELPLVGFDPARGQYHGPTMLDEVRDAAPPCALRVLALTEADLYADSLSFVFGLAETGGPAALVSIHRLRPEVYGQPPDRALFLRRVLVECVHELGHTFGLGHCHVPTCVMRFSNRIEESDRKGPGFCAVHARKLRVALGR